MIETRIYKCEYCGAEFDDEYEVYCHEWVCRYKNIRNKDENCLRFYNEDGTEIKFDNPAVLQSRLEDVDAFTVSNDSAVKFVIDFFAWYGYDDNPFRAIKDEKNPNYYGLWWFDPDRHYGEWVRVDNQIEKWTNIKNKFANNA